MAGVVNWNGIEEERFWKRVKIADSGCWEWIGPIRDNGYADFSIAATPERKGVKVKAHVWAYENCIGPVPDPLELDHLCRNRKCVNPLHLEPVTHLENVLRGQSLSAKASRQTHCINGHPFFGDNLYLYFYHGRPVRQCKICKARRFKEFKQRQLKTTNQ